MTSRLKQASENLKAALPAETCLGSKWMVWDVGIGGSLSLKLYGGGQKVFFTWDEAIALRDQLIKDLA